MAGFACHRGGPGCGTFPELEPLIERVPDHEIVGIDLSAGMVRRARERAARWPQVRVVQFDAYARSGPLRALVIARGDALIDQLRKEFLRRAPAGEWSHRPRARLVVARR